MGDLGVREARTRACAIDHHATFNCLLLAVFRLDLYGNAVVAGGIESLDAAAFNDHLAGSDGFGQSLVNGLGDTVMDHIPIGGVIPDEAAFFIKGEFLPDALGMRAKPIDHDAGIRSEPTQFFTMRLEQFSHPVEAEFLRLVGQKIGMLDAAKMRLRQFAIAGDADDPTRPVHFGQGEEHVDHAEPGAEHSNVLVPVGKILKPITPGIAEVAGMIRKLLDARKCSRRLVAGGQEHSVGDHRFSIAQVHPGPAVVHEFDADRCIRDALDGGGMMGVHRLHVGEQETAQIFTIYRARREHLAELSLGNVRIVHAGAQPGDKMVRMIREGRHVARGNVQNMLRSGGAIGHATTQGATVVHDHHAQGFVGQTDDVDG